MTGAALRRWALRAGAVAWLLLAGFVLATTVRAVVRAYTPVLFWDQWADLATLVAFDLDGGSLALLLRLHNEHCILVPRLFYLADYFWFDATGSSLVALNLILRAFTCALLIREARLAPELPWALRLFLAGATVALLFSAVQIGHFTMGFDVQFAVILAATVAAFVLTADAAARPESRWRRWAGLAAALACAGAALFSASNGVLVPLLLVPFVWVLPVHRREQLAVTGAALVLLTLRWAVGFRHIPIESALAAPLPAVQSAVAYLGSPLWLWPAPARVFGAAGFLLGGTVGIAGLVRFRYLPRFARVHVLVLCFVLGTAVAVGIGRTGWPEAHVLASRHAPGPLLLWVAIVSLGLFGIQQQPRLWRVGVPACCAIVVALVVGLCVPAQAPAARAALQDRADREAGELALVVGVYDEAALKQLYWKPSFILERRPFLRQEGLTSFSQDWTRQLGRPLAEAFRVEATTHDGAISAIHAAPRPPAGVPSAQAVSVRGWMEAGPGVGPLVLLVDGAGVIRGFARLPLAGTGPAGVATSAAGIQRVWTGYALTEGVRALRAYAVSADLRTAVPLAGAPVPPPAA